jgi:hypothetical protein
MWVNGSRPNVSGSHSAEYPMSSMRRTIAAASARPSPSVGAHTPSGPRRSSKVASLMPRT